MARLFVGRLRRVVRGVTILIASVTFLAFHVAVLAQERVVIAAYAGQGSQLMRQAVATPFEKETGVKTEVFESPLPSSSVLRAEGKPTFNVAIIGPYDTGKLSDAGALEEIKPEDLPNLRDIAEPFWVKSADGKLVGVMIYVSYYGIAYNTDMASASDFQSWSNLADAKWKGLVSISRAPFVAAYDVTLFAKLSGGDEKNVEPGFKMLKEVARNVTAVYTSMASLQAQLGRGEVVAAPFYSTQIAMLRRSGVKNIDILLPKDGGLLLPYTLVVPKGAPHPHAARKLINAVLSTSYQLRLAEGQGVWPTNSTVKLPNELEKELGGTLESLRSRTFSPDWGVVGRHHAERTRQVEALLDSVR